MTSGIEVRGLDGLAHLSLAFAQAGEQGKGLQRNLSQSIARETLQTRKAMRTAILPNLPKRGGLAADVLSSTRFGTKTSVAGNNVGVRITVRGRRAIRHMNATGRIRHPVFNRQDVWVTQTAGIHARFLDRPFEQSRPALQFAVLGAIAQTREDIYRRKA